MKIHKDIEQGTDEWLKLRKSVITGTKLKGVTSGPKAQLTEMYTLLAEAYIEEEPLNAYEIIERGHELEPIAKAKYEEITGNEVEEVGFITQEDWLGLSPDGIIADMSGVYRDIHYTKAIEIKCPRGKNYIKYLLEDRIPDEYKKQVIHYFVVMEELEELDFIIYNPDCSKEIKNFHIINVTREELQKDIEKAKSKLTEFKSKWDELKINLLNKGA